MPPEKKMKSVPSHDSDPRETRSGPEWHDHFHTLGLAAYGAKKRPRLEPAAAVAGAVALIHLYETNKPLAASVAVKLVDAAFLKGVGLLADELQVVLDKLPPDLRRIARLTPGDRKAIREAATDLSTYKKAIASAARSADDSVAAKAFGVGVVYVRTTADGVGDAIQHFLVGAEAYGTLMTDAALGVEELTTLRNHATAMTSIDSERGQRDGNRGRTSGDLAVLTLAIERWFSLYKGRVGLALAKDPVALAEALGPLPKPPTKRNRKAAAAVVAEASVLAEPALA